MAPSPVAATGGQRLLSLSVNARRRTSGSTLASIYEPHMSSTAAAVSTVGVEQASIQGGGSALSPFAESSRALAPQSPAATAAAAAAFGSDQTQAFGRFPNLATPMS